MDGRQPRGSRRRLCAEAGTRADFSLLSTGKTARSPSPVRPTNAGSSLGSYCSAKGLRGFFRTVNAAWLAKRYIRSAFPTAFDVRWRGKQKKWLDILKRNSNWIQGVYMRLSTLDELSVETPYRVHLLLAVPASKRRGTQWPGVRAEIEEAVDAFWSQVHPAIQCDGVEVLGLDEITLSAIELYQRFDSDWVSYEDDTPSTPLATDLRR